jgi:hypothetical protein
MSPMTVAGRESKWTAVAPARLTSVMVLTEKVAVTVSIRLTRRRRCSRRTYGVHRE